MTYEAVKFTEIFVRLEGASSKINSTIILEITKCILTFLRKKSVIRVLYNSNMTED